MREGGGPVPLFDLNPRLLPASDAIEEVAGMWQVDRSAPVLLTVDHRALVIHHTIAEVLTAEFADLRYCPIAINCYTVIAIFQAIGIPQALLEGDQLVLKLVGEIHRVR